MAKEKLDDEELDEDLDIDDLDNGSSIKGKDAYQMFMDSIRLYPKFTQEENLENLKEYKAADDEDKIALLDEIVEGNIRLVIKYANEIASQAVSNAEEGGTRGLKMDLIQEGSQALSKAIVDFDPARGYAFSTLAVTYIKRAMFAFLNNSSRMIHVPQQILDRHRLITKAIDELKKKNATDPSYEDVAEYLHNGLTAEDIEENCLVFKNIDVKTIDERPDIDNDKRTIAAVPSDEMNPQEASERQELIEKLAKATESLTPTMRFIISHRYPEDGSTPWTLRELSVKLNLSIERVRQIEEEAKAKLREMLS